MSPLTTLAIVAGALLAAVFAIGVATALQTRMMQNRELALAEALAGEKTEPPSAAPEAPAGEKTEPPSAAPEAPAGEETEPPSASRARRHSQVSQNAARQRNILEEVTYRWTREAPQVQMARAAEVAFRWAEGAEGWEADAEKWRSFINDLIRTGRRPHAAVLLLSADPEPIERNLADVVTWYRDQLLSLHPAYLATHASLLEGVTQLITLTIRAEQRGKIRQRRIYPRLPSAT